MKNKQNKILSLLLILSLFIGMVGIVNVDTTYAASKKIHLKSTKVSLYVGNKYQQKLIDKKGKTIKATKVKWKSSKTSIAKIDKNGIIRAVRSGTVNMSAKYKGKTYKFKVTVKKKPTKPKPSVAVDKTSLKIMVGETARVLVKTKNVNTIVWSTNNGFATPVWGDWSGSNIPLSITGEESGTTIVTVYDKDNKNVKATITVKVMDRASFYLNWLHDKIDKEGYVNGNGDRTIHYSISENNDVYYINHYNSIEFINYVKTDSVTTYTSMYLDTTYNAIVSSKVIMGSIETSTVFSPEDYTKNDKLRFTTDDVSPDTIQSLANSTFKLAMSSWNYSLLANIGINMNDLGFTSY